jgi:hypothetical protein
MTSSTHSATALQFHSPTLSLMATANNHYEIIHKSVVGHSVHPIHVIEGELLSSYDTERRPDNNRWTNCKFQPTIMNKLGCLQHIRQLVLTAPSDPSRQNIDLYTTNKHRIDSLIVGYELTRSDIKSTAPPTVGDDTFYVSDTLPFHDATIPQDIKVHTTELTQTRVSVDFLCLKRSQILKSVIIRWTSGEIICTTENNQMIQLNVRLCLLQCLDGAD